MLLRVQHFRAGADWQRVSDIHIGAKPDRVSRAGIAEEANAACNLGCGVHMKQGPG
jgi:hypothetical protein